MAQGDDCTEAISEVQADWDKRLVCSTQASRWPLHAALPCNFHISTLFRRSRGRYWSLESVRTTEAPTEVFIVRASSTPDRHGRPNPLVGGSIPGSDDWGGHVCLALGTDTRGGTHRAKLQCRKRCLHRCRRARWRP